MTNEDKTQIPTSNPEKEPIEKTEISNERGGINASTIPATGGGKQNVGVRTQSESQSFPTDPLVNIGCRFPNGILIKLPNRPNFRLIMGFTKINKSLWDMIVNSSQYKELIEEKTIYLSENGC